MREIAPTVPGKTSPGFQSSTTMPMRPIESMSATTLGSIRRSRMRFHVDISVRSTVVPGGVEIFSPLATVVVPSIWRKSDS